MKDLGWPIRVAVVLSVVWVGLVYRFTAGDESSRTAVVVAGLLPLGVLWGIGWVVAGFRTQRRSRRVEVSHIPVPSPSEPESTPPADWEPSISVAPSAGPWRRYLARFADIWLWSLLLGLALVIVGRLMHRDLYGEMFGWANEPGGAYWVGVVALPFALVADALVHRAFGGTPGKVLLGVLVRRIDGSPLSLRELLARNASIYMRGLAFGIPVASLVTAWMSYQEANREGRSIWDRRGGFYVSHPPRQAAHYVAFIVFFVALVALNIWSTSAPPVPTPPSTIGWTNPVTSKIVTLDASWRHIAPPANAEPNTFALSNTNGSEYVIFGYEKNPASIPLSDYAGTLRRINSSLQILNASRIIQDEGRVIWVGDGKGQIDESDVVIRVHIFEGDGGFWRVIYFATGTGPADFEQRSTDVYKAVLRSTNG